MIVIDNPLFEIGAKYKEYELALWADYDGCGYHFDESNHHEKEPERYYWSIFGVRYQPNGDFDGIDFLVECGSLEDALSNLIGIGVINEEHSTQILLGASQTRRGIKMPWHN